MDKTIKGEFKLSYVDSDAVCELFGLPVIYINGIKFGYLQGIKSVEEISKKKDYTEMEIKFSYFPLKKKK